MLHAKSIVSHCYFKTTLQHSHSILTPIFFSNCESQNKAFKAVTYHENIYLQNQK